MKEEIRYVDGKTTNQPPLVVRILESVLGFIYPPKKKKLLIKGDNIEIEIAYKGYGDFDPACYDETLNQALTITVENSEGKKVVLNDYALWVVDSNQPFQFRVGPRGYDERITGIGFYSICFDWPQDGVSKLRSLVTEIRDSKVMPIEKALAA